MSILSELISKKIEENKKLGFYRKIPDIKTEKLKSGQYPSDSHYNTVTVNLATNDYLGLSLNESVKKAARQAIDLYGTSAGSSFLICGHYDIHSELEKELCRFKGGYENCILYPSGYQANTGIIRTLAGISQLNTVIIFDELSHASIIDGITASGVKFKSFRHNDLNSLENALIRYKDYQIKLVITEGVFSMDGDIPDLPAILDITEKYGALSIVDDAHATGTIGKKGGGSSDFHNAKPDITIGTLGKALASNGSFVLSNSSIIEYFVNFSRAFIFSTGIPPSSAASALSALKIIKENRGIVLKLQNNAKFAREFLKESGLDTLNSSTHIIPILIGKEEKAVLIEKELLKDGIYLKAVRYPAVAKNKAILRLGINLTIDDTLFKNVLKEIVRKVKP
ncbi:MAG: aminotransferase class I/II-fold pyridoxal phosphate-dependent enzyme [Candidatus Acidulodesulfobacterium sp.]